MTTVIVQLLFVLALHAVVVWLQDEDLFMTKSCPKGYFIEHFNVSTRTTNLSVYNNKECDISLSDDNCYEVNKPMYFTVTLNDASNDNKVSKHVATNISWKSKRDGGVSEIILFKVLRYSDSGPANGTCVFFNSSILGQNSQEMHTRFPFDCLFPIDSVLQLEVLGYTERSSQRQCPQEVRSRNLCVQRSNQSCPKLAYLLSQARSRKRICSCHKDLSMHASYKSNGTFEIVFNNLPPFLERLLIEIVDELNASNKYKKELRGPIDADFTFLTDQFGGGNYNIYLTTYCGQDIQGECGDGKLQRVKFVKVPQNTTPQPKPYEMAIPVMASIIAFGIVTALSFCAMQVYYKHYRHSHQLLAPEVEVNNRNIENRDLYDQEQQPLGNFRIEDEVPVNKITLKPLSHHSCMLRYYLEHPNNQRAWMLVYHSDNMDHQRKIDTMCIELSQNRLKLSSGNSLNWPDFAELAAEKFRDIIMVVSEGLNGLCHDYMLRVQSSNTILEQRNFEIIPCVVMDKLRYLVLENPARNDFMLHIVSVEKDVEKGQTLVEKFLDDHPFIKRTKNYNVYQWGDPV